MCRRLVLALLAVWLAWRNVRETKPNMVQHNYQHQVKSTFSIPLLKLMLIVFFTGASTSMLAPIYLIYLQDKFTSDIGLLALAFLPGGLIVAFFAARLGNLSDRLWKNTANGNWTYFCRHLFSFYTTFAIINLVDCPFCIVKCCRGHVRSCPIRNGG